MDVLQRYEGDQSFGFCGESVLGHDRPDRLSHFFVIFKALLITTQRGLSA